MTEEQHAAHLSSAVDAWYRRSYPADPRRRANDIAEEWGLDADELYAACRADFAGRADCD